MDEAKKYTVDRIEGEYAVCELDDRSMINMLLSSLPFEAKEGMRFEQDGETYRVIENERSKRIKNLMDELWK